MPGAITDANLPYSDDGGDSWTDADVDQQEARRIAEVHHADASVQQVTIRVPLTDRNGDAMTHRVTRAYDVH